MGGRPSYMGELGGGRKWAIWGKQRRNNRWSCRGIIQGGWVELGGGYIRLGMRGIQKEGTPLTANAKGAQNVRAPLRRGGNRTKLGRPLLRAVC